MAFNHFMPLAPFYIPLKNQKTSGFLMLSGGTQKDQRYKGSQSVIKYFQIIPFKFNSFMTEAVII